MSDDFERREEELRREIYNTEMKQEEYERQRYKMIQEEENALEDMRYAINHIEEMEYVLRQRNIRLREAGIFEEATQRLKKTYFEKQYLVSEGLEPVKEEIRKLEAKMDDYYGEINRMYTSR